ncbi:hypothetical protein ACOME3_003305 [Neoechinorhynchus agilis]
MWNTLLPINRCHEAIARNACYSYVQKKVNHYFPPLPLPFYILVADIQFFVKTMQREYLQSNKTQSLNQYLIVEVCPMPSTKVTCVDNKTIFQLVCNFIIDTLFIAQMSDFHDQ